MELGEKGAQRDKEGLGLEFPEADLLLISERD